MRVPPSTRGVPPEGGGPFVRVPSQSPDIGSFDFTLAALAITIMTAGFWRLWPEARDLADPTVGATLVQAGVMALGFVGIAMRWETWWRAFVRNPTGLVLIGLALTSALWATSPPDTLRMAIGLLLMWSLSMALSLRFGAMELAEVCAIAGILGIFAQFGAHQGVPRLNALDGDLAFVVIATIWSVWCVPARRMVWILALGAMGILAVTLGDRASLGALLGFGLGALVGFVLRLNGEKGTPSVFVTAWLFVILIVTITIFALFGAEGLGNNVSDFYSQLGAQVLLGDGFGAQGTSISQALGLGLGIVGLGAGLFVLFGALFLMFLGNPTLNRTTQTFVAVWMAALGAVLAAPSQVSIFSPVCILLVASSFSISLACLPMIDPFQRP